MSEAIGPGWQQLFRQAQEYGGTKSLSPKSTRKVIDDMRAGVEEIKNKPTPKLQEKHCPHCGQIIRNKNAR